MIIQLMREASLYEFTVNERNDSMKKIISLATAFVLTATVFSGCTEVGTSDGTTASETTVVTEEVYESKYALSNPNADVNARKLYDYINEVYGTAIITCQQESTWMGSPDYEMNYIFAETGKYPAMRGLDFMNNDFDGVVQRSKEWHEKYDIQFQTESYERCIPEEKDSILEFLTSGLFKGIGEKKAKKIVDVLGKDTLKIILEQPNNLILIPGITEKNKNELHNRLQEYEASYDIIIKLGNLGFTTREAMIIYNFYKEMSLQKIDEDFYNLYYDLKKLSFKRIDMLAIKNNIPSNDPTRIEAGIIYVMEELTNNYGHSYYYIHELLPFVEKALHINLVKEDIISYLDNLIKKGLIIKKEDYYYLATIYNDEVYIVNRLNLLMHEKENSVKNIDEYINKIEQHLDISYNDDQKEAIKDSIKKNILIVTGGPGTGKTTILKAIIKLLQQVNSNLIIKLCAPTGRASKRMSELTGVEATTIHRLLKWDLDTNQFSNNYTNPVYGDVLIIDEFSMVDISLLYHLLDATTNFKQIIFIGDEEQLPPVSPGNVLKELVDMKFNFTHVLKDIYRQDENSGIIPLSYNVRQGILETEYLNKNDVKTIEDKTKEEIISVINKNVVANVFTFSIDFVAFCNSSKFVLIV